MYCWRQLGHADRREIWRSGLEIDHAWMVWNVVSMSRSTPWEDIVGVLVLVPEATASS